MLDFDFNVYEKIPIEVIVKNLKSKKRVFFDIEKENRQIEKALERPPEKDEVFKMLSGRLGFSSVATIKFISNFEKIEELYASSFRIGAKQIDILDDLKIKKATFITSLLNSKDKEQYNYYEHVLKVCKKNNWDLIPANNHSKIILVKTKKNYYVIETSSNLNENPKMEQYSFENDEKLYEFYKSFFESFKGVR